MDDNIDPLAKAMITLLGPTTIAGSASVWIRQWVKSKLKVFDALVSQAKRDQQWRGLAVARIRLLEDQLETRRRNDHQMRNYVTGLMTCVQTLAEALNVRVRLPDAPRWETPRSLTGDDLLKVLEADAGKPNAEESTT